MRKSCLAGGPYRPVTLTGTCLHRRLGKLHRDTNQRCATQAAVSFSRAAEEAVDVLNRGHAGECGQAHFRTTTSKGAMARMKASADQGAGNPNAKEDRHFVTSVARALDVLSTFRSSSVEQGNQAIAAACGLPRSTVARLTHTLTKLGYLELDRSAGKYRLGPASLALGASALSKWNMGRVAAPLIHELAEQTGAAVALGVREKLNMVYVEVHRGSSPFVLNVDSGWRAPLGTSAIGRAYLIACDENERNRLMDELRRHDESRWASTQAGIEAAMEEFRLLGCCSSFGDWHPDVHGIAVPVDRGPSFAPMAINCGGPAFNMTREYLMETVRPRLTALRDKLEASLRYA